jgi:hydrogenase-4 component F
VPVLGPGLAAMSWTALAGAAPRCDGAILNLAFVFLLIGYGTKAALAPLHTWMPNAHAEGPTPMSAVLAGSVMNVALIVILRLRTVMAANADAMAPGPPIMALGLLSVLIAAFSLWRRQDVKSFFAFSSIEQTGVAAFAFGLGGEAALFGGLLHMTLHTLAKAAIFQSVGRAAQLKRGQLFGDIGGLLVSHRLLGLTLAAGVVAIAALPPFGLFTSEFLIATETLRRAPLLSLPLGVGLVTGGWALIVRLQTLCLGAPSADYGPSPTTLDLVPAWVHLALVLALGLFMPGAVVAWLRGIAVAAS